LKRVAKLSIGEQLGDRAELLIVSLRDRPLNWRCKSKPTSALVSDALTSNSPFFCKPVLGGFFEPLFFVRLVAKVNDA